MERSCRLFHALESCRYLDEDDGGIENGMNRDGKFVDKATYRLTKSKTVWKRYKSTERCELTVA